MREKETEMKREQRCGRQKARTKKMGRGKEERECGNRETRSKWGTRKGQ